MQYRSSLGKIKVFFYLSLQAILKLHVWLQRNKIKINNKTELLIIFAKTFSWLLLYGKLVQVRMNSLNELWLQK